MIEKTSLDNILHEIFMITSINSDLNENYEWNTKVGELLNIGQKVYFKNVNWDNYILALEEVKKMNQNLKFENSEALETFSSTAKKRIGELIFEPVYKVDHFLIIKLDACKKHLEKKYS